VYYEVRAHQINSYFGHMMETQKLFRRTKSVGSNDFKNLVYNLLYEDIKETLHAVAPYQRLVFVIFQLDG